MNNITGKRVLVTGSLGFTGQYITQALIREGAEVIGCGHEVSVLPSYPYYALDLQDMTAINELVVRTKPQIVMHLAAIAFVGHADTSAFYTVNLLGTYHLLAALARLKKPPERVLIASSANVYGNQDVVQLSESAPYRPENDYAVSKMAMEQMAKLWSDLPIIITRPFNYTGIGQAAHFLIPKIVEHFKQRKPSIQLGNLEVSRDYTDVRTLTDVYIRLLNQPQHGLTVNVCSGQVWRLDQIIEQCQILTGHSLHIEQDPALMRQNEIKYLCGSPAQLHQIVGSDLKVHTFEETLAWMLGSEI